LQVNGVFIDRAKLVTQISKDQAARAKVEDGASISVISSGSQSLQARNAIFMWFQLFIEVLLRMHHKSTDRKELLDICKKNYKGNHQEMEIIDEFEKNYKPENAIWWYTRESCFYRMMNKALRVQDFDMLFALRFFITDIAKQLKNEYEKFIRTSDSRNLIRVYRGQVIGIDEFELMKNSIGEFLSMNSFLSTSRDRSIALHFARLTPEIDGTRRIIFEIEIDPRLQTKAFANVTSISYFQNEDEVLIMLGALFRIKKVIEDKKDRVWMVHVSLASEDDYHLKETFAYMKQMIGDDTDLDSLGKILLQMGEYEQAQKCYERMMHDLQVSTANCHVGLGKARHWQEESQPALSHYEQALKLRREILGPQHESVGEVYSYIGGVQWQLLKEYDQALISLNKAKEIQEKTLMSDPLGLARTYEYLASTYYCMDKYDLALNYDTKSLKIRETVLPPEHPSIANTYHNLGTMYDKMGDYAEALKFYQKSLEMTRKILPPAHPDLIKTENNIFKLKSKM
jgi:tetratricopeptide (TPR) repeat protein